MDARNGHPDGADRADLHMMLASDASAEFTLIARADADAEFTAEDYVNHVLSTSYAGTYFRN
jgi:hypothetical protein